MYVYLYNSTMLEHNWLHVMVLLVVIDGVQLLIILCILYVTKGGYILYAHILFGKSLCVEYNIHLVTLHLLFFSLAFVQYSATWLADTMFLMLMGVK